MKSRQNRKKRAEGREKRNGSERRTEKNAENDK